MWWFAKGARYRVENDIRVPTKGTGAGTHACPEAGDPIYLQQDGASPHKAKKNWPLFKAMGGNDGSTPTSPPWPRRRWKYSITPKAYRKPGEKNSTPKFMIKVVTQPARSPDLNINDLGFFCSFKHDVRAHPEFAENKDEYEKIVHALYEEYDSDKLEGVWRCLFQVFRQVLEPNGDGVIGAHVKVKHTGAKAARLRGEEADRFVLKSVFDAATVEYGVLKERFPCEGDGDAEEPDNSDDEADEHDEEMANGEDLDNGDDAEDFGE